MLTWVNPCTFVSFKEQHFCSYIVKETTCILEPGSTFRMKTTLQFGKYLHPCTYPCIPLIKKHRFYPHRGAGKPEQLNMLARLNSVCFFLSSNVASNTELEDLEAGRHCSAVSFRNRATHRLVTDIYLTSFRRPVPVSDGDATRSGAPQMSHVRHNAAPRWRGKSGDDIR